MALEYSYDSKSTFAKLDVDSIETQTQLYHFSDSLKLLRFLLGLYGVCQGKISFVKEFMEGSVMNMEFEITSNKGVMSCIFGFNSIRISSIGGYHLYSVPSRYPSTTVELKEFGVYEEKCTTIERFKQKAVEIEIHFNENNKVLFFDIPVNVYEIVKKTALKQLNQDSGLIEMQRFYMDNFYPLQSDFEKSGKTTTLSVWNSSVKKSDDPLDKGIKLDELQMGADDHHQISAVNGDVIVTLRDGVFSIYNYPINQDCDVDFNKVLADLNIRERRIRRVI